MRHNFQRAMCTGMLWLCGAMVAPSLAVAADSSATQAQAGTSSVKQNSKSVSEVLKYIETHSDYMFVYAEGANRQLDKRININLSGNNVDAILADMCAKAKLDYRIFGRQVTLFPKGKMPKNLEATTMVKGTVVDDSGEPLVGAAVVVKGAGEGTMTDLDGNFMLPASKGQQLEISYVGFATKDVTVGDGPMEIRMSESTNNLDEVVVVGYGTMKKKDLTGGLTVVGEEALKMSGSANLMDRLVGQVAGFSITSSEAKPGSDQSLLIRGTNSLSGGNSPLVVLDGIPYEGSIGDIDPNIVESLTVLKDASSVAIYGSRGSNGVILIQTKKGTKSNAKVVYKGTFAVASEMQRIETMGPNEYIQFKQDLGRLGTKKLTGIDLDPLYGQVISASERINYAQGITRDWQDDVFRTSFQHNHQLSISGGTDATSYMAAVSYLDQPGVVVNSNYERINVYTSIQQVLNKWLTIGLTGQFVNRETGGNTPNLEHAIKQAPYGIFMADDGNYYDEPMDYSNLPHPMRNVRADSKNTSRNVLYNGFIEIAPVKGLTLKSQYGYNYRDNYTGTYYGRNTAEGQKAEGKGSVSTSRTVDWTWENIVKYDNTFGKHHIDLTALYSMQEKNNKGTSGSAESFINDDMSFYSLGNGEKNIKTGSSFWKETMMSMMGRINYMFDSKYMVTLTGRRDGASVFGRNNKYAFFPSAALAWHIGNESFLRDNAQWLDMLKLRLSYGANGNNAISRYTTLDRLYTDAGIKYVWGDGSSAVNATFLPTSDGVGNPNLKWETTYTANIGIDYSFFNGRINGSIDIYRSRTKDLLMKRTVPIMNGYKNIMDNIGETENKGIEATLNTINIQTQDFQWRTSLSFFLNRDKIVELRGDGKDDINNKWFIGKPLSVFYDFNVIGIWQEGDEFTYTDAAGNTVTRQKGAQPGDAKLEDVNGDGVITDDDKKVIGSKRPSFTLSMSNQFNYKQFYASFMLYGSFGRWMSDNIPDISQYTFSTSNYIHGVKYWTPEHPENTDAPSPGYVKTFSHGYYKKQNYLQIKNITIGYSFLKEDVKRFGLSGLDINVGVDNLHVFSNMRQLLNYDNTWFASYPMQRAWRLGLTVTF